MRALTNRDWSGALEKGDPGFEEARYELAYLFRLPEGDPQDPDNDEDEDDD